MKLVVYFPDSWNELGINLRYSMPRGRDMGTVWYEMRQPKESYPGEVEVRLEDDE